jgi:hypothetical protein
VGAATDCAFKKPINGSDRGENPSAVYGIEKRLDIRAKLDILKADRQEF